MHTSDFFTQLRHWTIYEVNGGYFLLIDSKTNITSEGCLVAEI